MFDFESVYDYNERETEDFSVDGYTAANWHTGGTLGGYAVQNARYSDIENAVAEYERSNEWN